MYRGREGMLAWALHRITGVGIVVFLLLHIFDIFLIGFGAEVFEKLLVIYHAPAARFLILGLVFALLYHALNGLRIILMDFWPVLSGHKYYRKLIWATWIVFLIIFLPAAWGTIAPVFIGH